MANIFQLDIEARFPTYTVTLTTNASMSVCEVTDDNDSDKRVAWKQALVQQDAILSCREQLGIPKYLAPLVTVAQQASATGQLKAQVVMDPATDLCWRWDGSSWVAV